MRLEPGVALLSPRVVGADGRQQFLCKRYPSVLVLLLRVLLPRFMRPLFQRSLNHYQMRDICAGDREARGIGANIPAPDGGETPRDTVTAPGKTRQ